MIVADLDLDGGNAARLPSPTVNADRVVFRDDRRHQRPHGDLLRARLRPAAASAPDAVIEHNRIHDCGRLPRRPTTTTASTSPRPRQHAITATGSTTTPTAASSSIRTPRTRRSTSNVIDGNGEGIIFSGDGGVASKRQRRPAQRDQQLDACATTSSPDWPTGQPGRHRQRRRGELPLARGQGNIGEQIGFVAASNNRRSRLCERSTGDFALAPGSPCAGYGPAGDGPAQSPPPPPPPPPAATAPQSTAPPSVSGTLRAGSRLKASSGSWSGTSPLTFTYAWQGCDASGANCAATSAAGSSYVVGTADAGSTLRVVVRAQNAAGAASAASAVTAVVPAKKAGKTVTRQSLVYRPQNRPQLLSPVRLHAPPPLGPISESTACAGVLYTRLKQPPRIVRQAGR